MMGARAALAFDVSKWASVAEACRVLGHAAGTLESATRIRRP